MEPENKPEQQLSQPEAKPNGKRDLLKLVWDLLWDLKSIKAYIENEFKHFSKFPILVVLGVFIGGMAGWFTKSHFADKELNTVTVAYQSTNSFLSGQLNSTKDELTNVKQECDKYQNMLAPFQALAEHIYTNVPSDQRLDSLTGQFVDFKTNLFAQIEAERPFFELYINNKLMTNYSYIDIHDSRTLNIAIYNGASVSANEAIISLTTPPQVDPTNYIHDAYWQQEPPVTALTKDGTIGTNIIAYDFKWASDSIVPPDSYHITTFQISKTAPVSCNIFNFEITAAGAKEQSYAVYVQF